MHGAAAPFGPRSPSKGASVLIYPSLVSILVFLRPVMHPSGRRPPILFLVLM